MRSLVPLSLCVVLAGCGTQIKTHHQARAPGHPLHSVGQRHEADAVKGTSSPAQGLCGVERWAVKVMSDAAAANVVPTPVDKTIADLAALPAPVAPTDRTPGAEETMFRLTNVHLESFKQEADSDIHLALADDVGDALLRGGAQWTDLRLRGHTMIAEIPDPSCMQGAAQSVIDAVSATRQHFIARFGQPTDRYQNVSGATISLQGVGFFDRLHGQRGVAPNGIELHPVVADP